MKISDFKNEDALDLLADIIDPTSRILTDIEVQNAIKGNCTRMHLVKLIIKKHKSDILEILARLDGKDPKDYSCDLISLTKSILDLLNDEVIVDFFKSQGQMMVSGSSTPATENIEAKEQ